VVTLALLFACGVWWFLGQIKALEFVAGYLVELSCPLIICLFSAGLFLLQSPDEVSAQGSFLGVLGARHAHLDDSHRSSVD
jgi:hypothetical protein